MKLADLHCDAPFELYRRKTSLYDGTTDYTLKKCRDACIESILQVMAFWSDAAKSMDECYDDFFAMLDYFNCEKLKFSEKFPTESLPNFIIAVEGARLLGKNPERLEVLRKSGVRVLTPLWGGNELCGGAYDTDAGLTNYGKEIIKECETLGIIVDVSHMSEKSFWDTVNVSEKPIVATHSDSAAVCGNPRNLSDIQARTIAEKGGVIGVSVCAKHVSQKYDRVLPKVEDMFVKEFCDHIEHYLGLDECFAKVICMGCDFDGTETCEGIKNVSDMVKVEKELLNRGIKENVVDNIMWKNAFDFFERAL